MLHSSSLKRALVTALVCTAFGATVTQAQTAEELLNKIRAERTAEQNLAREREARFRNEMEEQRKQTAKVMAEKNAADARTKRLDAEYDANEKKIKELNVLLENNKGNLGELFGVTRQVSGDTLGTLSASLVNTQLAGSVKPGQEDRIEFLRRLSVASALPSIRDLERMWLETLSEMKASGESARYTASVIVGEEPDGGAAPADGSGPARMKDVLKDMEVVRVGTFMAYGDNKYLVYLSSKNKLAELERQPVGGGYMDSAAAILKAPETGYVEAVVDPARGQALLSQVVERPNWLERVNKGEKVVWITAALGIIGLVLALFQYGYLALAKLAVAAQLKNMSKPMANNALGRMLLAVNGPDGHASDKDMPEVVELRISESVLREIPKLERFQSFLRMAVAAGPLLGLIGTVIGMIITFESITASGSSDPKLMAQGIGQAMIATVMGLGIAIPLLFLNTGLVALSRSVTHVLEEESSSLLTKKLRQQSGH